MNKTPGYLFSRMYKTFLCIVFLVFSMQLGCQKPEETRRSDEGSRLLISPKESFEDANIYLVAFQIEIEEPLFTYGDVERSQIEHYSIERFKRDRNTKETAEIHYYFYEPGSKIPPFSKIRDYNRVEELLWVDVKSFDSPLVEWTNALSDSGALYDWKIE
ncbi:MAG: hypothetical protein VW868_09015 [Bacteroidota bacterium]